MASVPRLTVDSRTVDHEMSVQPVMTNNQPAWDSTGPAPEQTFTPEAVWYPKSEVAALAAS
jgi:hypothetical protein